MFCCAKVGPLTADEVSTVGPKIIFKEELEEEQVMEYYAVSLDALKRRLNVFKVVIRFS